MEKEDFAARRAELRAKLREKCKTSRNGPSLTARQASEAAQNALLSIDDPALFEEAKRAIQTKNTSSLLKQAMQKFGNDLPSSSNCGVEDEEEAPPPPPPLPKQREDEEEAPPPSPPPYTKTV